MIFDGAQWAAYLPWRDAFGEAMDPRCYTIDWLDRQVMEGRVRVWTSDNAAIVAELKAYPAGAVEVHGTVAAGDLDGIVSLIPNAEKWGRENGAILASVSSHPAWQRLLKASGYAPSQLTLLKELM